MKTPLRNSLIATAILALTPIAAYSQVESGPTPAKNGKQDRDVKTKASASATPDEKKADVKAAADPKRDGSLAEDDAKFLRKAANSGMFEVEAGKYAEKNGSTDEVKKLGAMMVADHTKANTVLMAVAKEKGTKVPAVMNKKYQERLESLTGLKGAEFDKAYIEAMKDAHKSDVSLFSAAAEKAEDADVKAFAAKTLPTLKTHMEHVEKLGAK
jgi:putative membrane protein